MTINSEIKQLQEQLDLERSITNRTLEAIGFVQTRLDGLSAEYRRILELTTRQESTIASLADQLDAASVENERLQAENRQFRVMLTSKPIESSPLSSEELQILADSNQD